MRDPDQPLPEPEITAKKPEPGECKPYPDPSEEEVWEGVCEDASKQSKAVIGATVETPAIMKQTSVVPVTPAASVTLAAPVTPAVPVTPEHGIKFIIDGFRTLGNAPDLRR